MSDESAPQPRIKVSWLFATLIAFAIFVAIGIYSRRMTNDYPDYDQQRAAVRYQTLAKVQAVENALINPVDKQGQPTAEWVDETKGTVRIPIDEAMTQEVDALKDKAPAMGNALPVTAPVPAATNAPPASTNAPAASANAASTNAAPAAAPTTNAAPATNAPPAAPATKAPSTANAKKKPASAAKTSTQKTAPEETAAPPANPNP